MIPLAAVHRQGSGHPNKRQQTKMHYLSFSVILFNFKLVKGLRLYVLNEYVLSLLLD